MKARQTKMNRIDETLKTLDPTQATIGWIEWGTGTVGITKGETLRLFTVNVGSIPTVVLCGLWQNPPLIQDSFMLQPGESKSCDVNADDIEKELFDETGRVQIRAFVRTSSRAVIAHVELFANGTGRTSVVLPLQELRC